MSAAGSIAAAGAAVAFSASQGNGGAFASAGGALEVVDSRFASVASAGLGGALHSAGNVSLARVAFSAAQAGLQGGAVYARSVLCTGGCSFTNIKSLRQARRGVTGVTLLPSARRGDDAVLLSRLLHNAGGRGHLL